MKQVLFTDQEMQGVIDALDIAVKQSGLACVPMAFAITQRLTSAVDVPDPALDTPTVEQSAATADVPAGEDAIPA
jgi:hypothetical protein